jgi:CheY-like chemotaxis protein
MVQNRGILLTLRAAAMVIIATGLNDVIASAVPRYEPLYLYLGAIAVVGLLDGVILALLTALLCVGFYGLLFMPRADVLTARMLVPAGAAFATALVAATIRGIVRVSRRRREVQPVYTVAPPLLETSSVARVAESNVEVLAAIDDLRSELRTAVAELGSTRGRAAELEELRRSQNAEREAVEARARQLEHDRDWALKTAQADRTNVERERAMRADTERQLAMAREEAAAMAGRVAELELSSHERDRERAEAAELRRALELERKRAEGEKTLREEFAADGASLRTRIGELEEALSSTAPVSEFDELRRALAETRNARDRARGETMAEKSRAEELERSIAAERAEGDSRVGEERKRADVAVQRAAELEQTVTMLEARIAESARLIDAAAKRSRDLESAGKEERAIRERLEAEIAQFDAKLETISNRLAVEHEAELGEATKERDAARAEAQASRDRVAELETAAATFDDRVQTLASHLASDHEADLGNAVAEREEARAEGRRLRARVAELEDFLAQEKAKVEASLAEREVEFDEKLQTIVTHLASDHEADLGQALSEKEAAKAETRALSLKLSQTQRKLEEVESQLLETRSAAHKEIDRLRAQIAAATTTAAAPNRPRVLVVHPDADVRGAAQASLERAGYEVVGAADGLEALRVAIATQPEVVVAESSMPKMDGRELCQLLKSQEKTAKIRFVLLMRAGDDPPRGEFTPDEVLRKPVPVETLRATLAGLLSDARRS